MAKSNVELRRKIRAAEARRDALMQKQQIARQGIQKARLEIKQLRGQR
jgi:hypothetical protein